MKPVWNSDIEPFAIRVTTKRLPDTKHYGDVSTLNGADSSCMRYIAEYERGHPEISR